MADLVVRIAALGMELGDKAYVSTTNVEGLVDAEAAHKISDFDNLAVHAHRLIKVVNKQEGSLVGRNITIVSAWNEIDCRNPKPEVELPDL